MRTDLDDLLRDGSWRLDEPAEAEFRLTPATTAGRGALVERILGRPEPDPELWESVLIEALLDHPVADGLRTLRLRLTDFHHSARRTAIAIAGRPRPALTELSFGHGFRFLFENATTSTGRALDALQFHDVGLVGDAGHAMWRALPSLRTLTVEGAFVFHGVESETVTDVRLRGVVSSDGSILPGPLPALTTLTLEIGTDVFGTECAVEQLEELTPVDYPSLRVLDLRKAQFDTPDVLEALSGMPIRAQLERVLIE
ncbi:hypothetical protein ACGFJ7_23605 [Actinoplanes sp. NPDC048988]|uniref:hypothetical protein n=1 Tax=Actinoplanes sp. NPDC048988 TaxID=3363901 RepID=UPI00370FACC0